MFVSDQQKDTTYFSFGKYITYTRVGCISTSRFFFLRRDMVDTLAKWSLWDGAAEAAVK